MSTASPIASTLHRFTREQYYRMAESGVLREEDRVELLNGEVTDMSPIGLRHAGTVRWLRIHFGPLTDGRAVVGVRDPVVLNEWNEPEPDVWLAAHRTDLYSTGHPTATDLLLVVEVADTTLEKDRQIKIPLYAAVGVREVWLVDLVADSLHVFRDPAAGEFRDIREWKRGETTAPLAFPELLLRVDELFPK
jgi:Uma2 family endonuclease